MYNLENIRQNLANQLETYTNIIIKEYNDILPKKIKNKLHNIKDYKEEIVIEDTHTISLFVNLDDGKIYLPTLAEKVLETIKQYPEYGTNPNHHPCQGQDLIENNNTFIDYINHAIIAGLTPEKYYAENLLHESLHFCGFAGAGAIEEGITEYRTRQLAKKYNLLTSGCGYPKEVKLVRKLATIFGEDILTEINLENNYAKKIEIITKKLGTEEAQLYDEIDSLTSKEFVPYIRKKYDGPMAPIKKAESYQKIDYSKVYKRIDLYEKKHKNISDDNKELNEMLSTTPSNQEQKKGIK